MKTLILIAIALATLIVPFTSNAASKSTSNADVDSLSFEYFDETQEAELEIEPWMVNDEVWSYNETVNEPELSIEKWMSDDNYWSKGKSLLKNSVEGESELVIQKWMTDNKTWRL
ncbi:MAG: hypothetical protein JW735_02625 [Prolixibacteraceae bacterium]|jgi:hypothetical protein|nr:hypothetical protein [Prolixibacteraceae bacterium]